MGNTNERIIELINYLLVIIPLAGGLRCIYCLVAMSVDSDDEQSYRIRIRNTIFFILVAESIIGIWQTIAKYFM